MKSEGKKRRDKGGIWTLEGKKRWEQEIQRASARIGLSAVWEWPEPCPGRGNGIIELLNSQQFLQWLPWVPALPHPWVGATHPLSPLSPCALPCRSAEIWEVRREGRMEGGRAAQTQHPPALGEPAVSFTPITHSGIAFSPPWWLLAKQRRISWYSLFLFKWFFSAIRGVEGVKVIISSMSTASPHPRWAPSELPGQWQRWLHLLSSQPRSVPNCWSLLICVFSLEACWFNHFKDAHFFQARDFMTLRIRSCYPNKPWSSIYSDFMVSFTNKLFKTYANCVYCIL